MISDGGGGGGGGGPSKLAIALIIIVVISLLLFFAQLFYILWRRRIFRRQTYAVGGGGVGSRGDEVSRYSSSESSFTSAWTASYSKELLYFFSARSLDFRLDGNSATATSISSASDLNSDRQSDFEAVDIDLLKLYGMFGPPKVLFTIKEDQEKQAVEFPAGISPCPSELEAKTEVEVANQNGTGVCSENSSTVAEKEEIENRGGVDDITPFSTPCGSPLYLTPTASPVHEKLDYRSGPEVTSTST